MNTSPKRFRDQPERVQRAILETVADESIQNPRARELRQDPDVIRALAALGADVPDELARLTPGELRTVAAHQPALQPRRRRSFFGGDQMDD